MALSNPRGLFGVHSVVFYDRTTGLPIVGARVIGEFNSDFKAEIEDLVGGSNMFAWDGEIKSLSSDISFTGREYSGELMELLLGGDLTNNAAEASGSVSTLTNVKGTSVKSATTGIASVAVDSSPTSQAAELKTGKYIVKAASATTVNVYCLTDVDFQEGTDEVFEDDTYKITPSALTITTSTGTDVTNFGLTLTGGSGTIGMTTGDTAEFYVRKINEGSIEVIFGQVPANFQEFGLYVCGQRLSDGTINRIEFYKVKGAGMPLNLKEKAWSEFSASLKCYYDSDKNAVGKFTRVVAA